MNALLAALSLALGTTIALTISGGSAAVLLCGVVAVAFGIVISTVEEQRTFLLQVFVSGLLVRVLVGVLIYNFALQEFFGGDAYTYDQFGNSLLNSWRGFIGEGTAVQDWANAGGGWGMFYLVAAIYGVTGRNMLAVQFFNAVIGATTAPVIFLCARHIFQNLRVARLATLFVAFFPSLVLWSSQGLKDGPIIFLLAVSMLATLKLGERLSTKYFTLLVLALTYLGVLRGAGAQLESYGNLQAVQTARSDQAQTTSGFSQDVDVSTTFGAMSAIPVGLIYLLFAPFPWQLANLRQSITLPEMLVWWGSFPLLVMGVWFTVKYRLRQALPILIFTSMLTLAYSIFQGNVGTAYRQRAQILVFYFIFVAVGAVLVKEARESRRENVKRAKHAATTTMPADVRAEEARRRYDEWKREREKVMEDLARGLSERINF